MNWTTGDEELDEYLQSVQLGGNGWEQILEWIPYDQLSDVDYIAGGGYGNVYSATWINGPKDDWIWNGREWLPDCPKKVALKSPIHTRNVEELLMEVRWLEMFCVFE